MEGWVIAGIVVGVCVAIFGAFVMMVIYHRRVRIDKEIKEAHHARRAAANRDIELMAGLRTPPSIYGHRADPRPLPYPYRQTHREQVTAVRHPVKPTRIQPPPDPRAFGMGAIGDRPSSRLGARVKNRPYNIYCPPPGDKYYF